MGHPAVVASADPVAEEHGPRWPVRAFVVLYLSAVIGAGIADIELWPLTGWRLFSHVRTGEQRGWQVTYVDQAGRETPIPFADLPQAYHQASFVAAEFPDMAEEQRGEVCLAWAEALIRRGIDVAAVRVYRTSTAHPSGPGGRSVRSRALYFQHERFEL